MSGLVSAGLGLAFLFQDDYGYSETAAEGGGAIGIVGGLVGLALAVFFIACFWKVFQKAGEPGWAAIVPIYNLVVLMRIAGRPAWWVLLALIPGVNLVVGILVAIDVAKAFGKGTGFGLGLALLGFVFYPILAFDDSQYRRA